jgi:hypothetical protein
MTALDIIVPVLSRPGNAQPLIDSIRANTTVEHTITFMVSPDDTNQLKACEQTDADIYIVEWQPGPADASKKWNLGYRITSNPYVFTAADDLEFEFGWDTEILRVAENTGAGMVGSNDDANPLVKRGRHSTHSLFSRAYIDTVGGTFFDGPGIVYCEKYQHQWIDTEAVKAAMDRRQWAFAMMSVVRHHHPFYYRATPMDDTYRKALGDASEDQRLYKQRLLQWSGPRR